MRNLFQDRWNLWPRLTIYRTWKDLDGHPIMEGTNNADERAIGWWVKERYRPKHGYKLEKPALNVCWLIAFCGDQFSKGLELVSIIR
jgi:hypothetical protein